jgi:F0F1-type ATP synthase membrane subunit c/vacuolar-type H+-ATPase subunit K
MAAMSTSSPAGFPRRRLLAGAAGLALLATGCTSGGSDGPSAGDAARTSAQDDRLAGQVPVQAALVAAYDAAAAADPALGGAVAPLAEQARTQLERLRAAAPAAASASAPVPAPPAGGDVRSWLRGQVAAAATSHTGACVDTAGPRAALLGSVAAGLRGHEAALA